MSKITHRTTRSDEGSIDERLARLLEAPGLSRLVPRLPAEALHQLIRHRGLEACADVLTAATPSQLTAILDLDLWRSARPGRNEDLDVDRFGEWLEVLADIGASAAARMVAALDRDLVVAGLSRCVRVLDPGIFEPTAQSDDEAIDRHEAMREGEAGDASIGALECEVGGYVVRARRVETWDAVVATLVALEAERGDVFHAVMQGCRRLSNSRPESDGLDNLAQWPEQHFHEVTIERGRRQSLLGYATPADARAFLQMARGSSERSSQASGRANPIVAAYFRALDGPEDSSPETMRMPERRSSTTAPRSALTSVPAGTSIETGPHGFETAHAESFETVLGLLTEAGMLPERPPALPPAAQSEQQSGPCARLREQMDFVRGADESLYFERTRELGFLANALVAGCSVQSRAFTAQEAADAAACVCNLGLECWPGVVRRPAPSARGRGVTRPSDDAIPESFLIDHDLVTAFEVGWSVLYQDVTMFVTDRLIAMVDTLRHVDTETARDLVTLRRALARQRDAGTPWLARGQAEVLAMLDMTAWIVVLGLLDECPVLPAALTAILEGRTTGVSQTAFEFISSRSQIEDVRRFMRRLPDVLLA